VDVAEDTENRAEVTNEEVLVCANEAWSIWKMIWNISQHMDTSSN